MDALKVIEVMRFASRVASATALAALSEPEPFPVPAGLGCGELVQPATAIAAAARTQAPAATRDDTRWAAAVRLAVVLLAAVLLNANESLLIR